LKRAHIRRGAWKAYETHIIVNPLERVAISAGLPFAAAILELNSSTSLPNDTRQTRLDSKAMTKPSTPRDVMILVRRLWLLSTAIGLGTLGRISAREAMVKREKKSK